MKFKFCLSPPAPATRYAVLPWLSWNSWAQFIFHLSLRIRQVCKYTCPYLSVLYFIVHVCPAQELLPKGHLYFFSIFFLRNRIFRVIVYLNYVEAQKEVRFLLIYLHIFNWIRTFVFNIVCVCVCVCRFMSAGVLRVQRCWAPDTGGGNPCRNNVQS